MRAAGFDPVTAPVLEARLVSGAVIDLAGVDAIAFTSGHAARAFAALCPARDHPVYAVGDATAALARAVGFAAVRSSAGGARALARAIGAAEPRPALVLNPTLAEPAADLEALLAEYGVRVRTVVVYDTAPASAARLPESVDSILIHSAKAARIVAGAVSPDQARRLTVFAISPAAAAPLQSLPFARIATAPFPDETSLIALLEGG